MDWKGIKVTVRLSVVNRVVSGQRKKRERSFTLRPGSFLLPFFSQATPTIVPTASALIMKELKEAPRDRKKVKNIKHSGNITFDSVINIARILRFKSMAKKLKGTVKEVLGTAFSIGCTVNGKSPVDLQKEIDDGSLTVPDE
jgi:large subunit ribosomal protein L12e